VLLDTISRCGYTLLSKTDTRVVVKKDDTDLRFELVGQTNSEGMSAVAVLDPQGIGRLYLKGRMSADILSKLSPES
jgi:hypothetical protein